MHFVNFGLLLVSFLKAKRKTFLLETSVVSVEPKIILNAQCQKPSESPH